MARGRAVRNTPCNVLRLLSEQPRKQFYPAVAVYSALAFLARDNSFIPYLVLGRGFLDQLLRHKNTEHLFVASLRW